MKSWVLPLAWSSERSLMRSLLAARSLLPTSAVPEVHVFLHTSRTVRVQVDLAFEACAVAGETGKNDSQMVPRRLSKLCSAFISPEVDLFPSL